MSESLIRYTGKFYAVDNTRMYEFVGDYCIIVICQRRHKTGIGMIAAIKDQSLSPICCAE